MLPRDDYDLLRGELEALRKAVQEISAEHMAADDEPIPGDVLDAIARGASPIKAWRKYRRMTQAALASAIGVTPAAVHYIETGVSYGRRQTRRAIADALHASQWAIDPARFLYLNEKSSELAPFSQA
jgi:DNA-binding XRE family transcriptional regulator